MLNHLKNRYFTRELYRNVAYNDEERVVTFPLYNLSGQYLGYQQYRPDGDKVRKNNPKLGRYFTYIPRGNSAIWGIDVLDKKDRRIFITEGIFKSCRFHNYGLNSYLAIMK